MKKYFIIALSLVLAAACSKVENNSFKADQSISFKVLNYAQQTRANSAFTGDSFGTWAFWTPTDWATDGDVNLYMKANEKVVYGPSYAAGEWGPETEYFWPKTGSITFASYAPYKENGAPTFSKADGFVFTDYVIPATTDEDLLVADLAIDQTQNGTQYGLSENTQGVPTLFRHVLTQIAFQFKTVANPNPNVNASEIVIKEVKIKTINNKATYTQNNTPVWAGQDGSVEYEFNPATGNDITVKPSDTEAAKTKVESRIVLPQELKASDAAASPAVVGQQIEISYVIRTEYKSNPGVWAEEEVTSVADLRTAAIPVWEPNMNIVYTITINPVSDQSILFDPAVADWTNVEGSFNILPE